MSIVARGLGSPRTGSLVGFGLTVRTPISLARAGRACLAIAAATTMIVLVC